MTWFGKDWLMPAAVTEIDSAISPGIWSDAWIAELVDAPSSNSADCRCWRSVSGTTTLIVRDDRGSDLRVAEDARRVVLFAGLLTNAGELRAGARATTDAAGIVAAELLAKGDAALDGLRGPFAVVAWDR